MIAIVLEVLDKIKNKHLNDPTISDDKDIIVELFLKDLNETINVINNLDEDSLEWLSSRFEELSYKFQSKKFVECLNKLLIKFPESNILKQDVQEAVEAYYGDKE